MNAAEYANLEEREGVHWYYAGKREIARRWLQRVGPVRSGDILLDCGAGTGRFAQEMEAHCRVLVLDEPSTALAVSDVERLFVFLRKLKARGVAIIYVSHRMDEIARIADRAA